MEVELEGMGEFAIPSHDEKRGAEVQLHRFQKKRSLCTHSSYEDPLSTVTSRHLEVKFWVAT